MDYMQRVAVELVDIKALVAKSESTVRILTRSYQDRREHGVDGDRNMLGTQW